MGHYASEMDFRRDDGKAQLWERRDAIAAILEDMPLSAFTFGQLADLNLVADRSAVSNHSHSLTEALDRLEKFLTKRARKKPLKGSAKSPRRRK